MTITMKPAGMSTADYATEHSEDIVEAYVDEHPDLFRTRKPSRADLVELVRRGISAGCAALPEPARA
jgi:hypothetical protein